jgi:hypothetical protein
MGPALREKNLPNVYRITTEESRKTTEDGGICRNVAGSARFRLFLRGMITFDEMARRFPSNIARFTSRHDDCSFIAIFFGSASARDERTLYNDVSSV